MYFQASSAPALGGSSNSSSSSSSSTNPEIVPCPIGELEGNQFPLLCPTGFKRHPKYCNLFYQCTVSQNNLDTKVVVLSCPNDTVYDGARLQCLPQSETESCNGEVALSSLYRKLTDNSLPPVSKTYLLSSRSEYVFYCSFRLIRQSHYVLVKVISMPLPKHVVPNLSNVKDQCPEITHQKGTCTNVRKVLRIGLYPNVVNTPTNSKTATVSILWNLGGNCLQ